MKTIHQQLRRLAGHPRRNAHGRAAGHWAAVVLVCWAAALFPLRAAAQDQPPDLPTYTGWVREAFAAAQRNDRLGLEAVAGLLTATTNVRGPDDALIAVDNGWLAEALQETEPDLSVIAERLGAIIDALALPQSAVPADARERLQNILDRPPFRREESDPNAYPWLRYIFDWLARILDSIFRPIGTISPSSSAAVAWTLGTLGALLLIGVIVYLLLGLRRSIAAEARADDDPEANLTARAAVDQAGDLARDGDYRSAMRYLYLSALLWLDEHDLLRYDRALTNREYLERVRDNPALRERLAPIIETFDRVWYGHIPLDAESFAAYRAQVEALRQKPHV